MALIKPLKLKSEKVSAKQVRALDRPVASVIVETKVFHLNEPYSYLVPETLTDVIELGTIVKVPFGRSTVEGVVLARAETETTVGLKFIEDAISTIPAATENQLELFRSVAHRYGCAMWDVIRLALPTFSKTGEKGIAKSHAETIRKAVTLTRDAITINNLESLRRYLVDMRDAHNDSRVLVIVPDQKTLDSLTDLATLVLSGEDSKSIAYQKYLKANSSPSGLIVGLRSAVFIDLRPQDLLVVVSDTDSNLYERHTPTYNVRDIALLRAQSNSVAFIGYTHSLEISRLIEKGYLSHKVLKSAPRKILADVPERVQGIISEGLKTGSVLVVHANTGYVKSFGCNTCRNIATCECGSRLILARNKRAAKCETCGWKTDAWQCTYCSSGIPRVFGSGVEYRAEEYGRSYPKVQIVHSTGDHPVAKAPGGTSLVISTPGMEPEGKYSAILLLDGEQIFGRVGLRSDEQGEGWWARAASHLEANGTLYISLPSAHPITQSFIRGSFDKSHVESIAQRSAVQLPPDFRLLTFEGSLQELMSVRTVFEAIDFEAPVSLIGPMQSSANKVRLIIKYPVEMGSAITTKAYEINRVRSLQGLKPLRMAVDPYDFI